MKEYRNAFCTLFMIFPFLYLVPIHSFFSWVVKKQIKLREFNVSFESTALHYGLLILINFMFNVMGTKMEAVLLIICFASQRNLHTHITPTFLMYGCIGFMLVREARVFFWEERDQVQYNRELESKAIFFIILMITVKYMLVRLIDIIKDAEEGDSRAKKGENRVSEAQKVEKVEKSVENVSEKSSEK